MKQVDRSHWYFLIPLFILVILGIYQCFTMAHAANAVDRVQRLYDPAAPGDSATVRNDTLNAMALVAIKAVKVRVTQRLETDSIVGSLSSVAIIDDTLWLNRDSTNCVMVVWFVGTGAGIKYNCTTDSLYWTRDGSTWVQFGTGGGGAGTGDIDAVTAGSGLAGGGTSGSVTIDVITGWGLRIHNDSVKINATQLLDSAVILDRDSTFAAHRSSRWLPYPGVTGQTIGNTTDSGFVEFVDSTSGNSYGRYWTRLFYWEVVPDSAIPTWGRVNAAIGSAGGGDITGVLANDWITGSASSGDVSLGINPSMLAALYLGGDTTFVDGAFVKIAADTSFVLDLYRGVVTADSAYPTIARVNAAIAASPAGDITNVGVTAPITGGGSSGSVTVGFDWTWLYGFVDTTTASIPVATLSNSVLYSWLYTTIDTSSATVLSVAMGNGGTGGGSNGALTLNVVGSDEIAVTADSIYVADSKIKSVHLEDGTVSLADHAANSVDSTKIVNSSVGNEDLQTGSVNSAKILDASVALGDMASNSVDSTKIVDASIGSGDIGTGRITTTHILDGTVALADHASNSVDSTKIVDASIGSGDIGTGRITTTHILDGTIVTGDIATGGVATADILDLTVAPADVDSTGSFIVANLRTRAANQGLIQSNNFKATDSDSTLKIGGGGGITIGSNITLGTDITDDTSIVTLASEWAGMVLARGYRDDSTKYWDSVTIRGGSDSYGNYIEFGKLGSDTTGTTPRRRHLQVAIPVPMDADTVYDVALSYRVFDGTGGESTYVRLKWSTTPFDSTNIFKTAYTELDSTNGTTFDTLSAAYARTSVSRGSKIYALVTGLLYDKHVTWIRCYDLIMTYHRRYL